MDCFKYILLYKFLRVSATDDLKKWYPFESAPGKRRLAPKTIQNVQCTCHCSLYRLRRRLRMLPASGSPIFDIVSKFEDVDVLYCTWVGRSTSIACVAPNGMGVYFVLGCAFPDTLPLKNPVPGKNTIAQPWPEDSFSNSDIKRRIHRSMFTVQMPDVQLVIWSL